MYFDTPNISMPEAMPANSEKVVATLPMRSASMAKAAMRMPKRSRMRAAKAFARDGAHASGRGLHDSEQHAHDGDDPQVPKPKFAPAVE